MLSGLTYQGRLGEATMVADRIATQARLGKAVIAPGATLLNFAQTVVMYGRTDLAGRNSRGCAKKDC